MRLSAEMYNQIVEGLKSDSRGEKDKRREPRVGLAGDAPTFTVDGSGKKITGTVRVRDVSRTGIGLICSFELMTHQRFVIQLTHEDDQPLWLVCAAAYCKPIEGGRFTIGAKIEQILGAAQIHQMEQKNVAASAARVKAAMAARAAAAPAPVIATEANPIPGMASVNLPASDANSPLNESDIARISKAILG